ncbi:cobalamin biosynthesis protein [Desulfovibrio sp. OttesenSCG-928-G11]|nr:cobalamin biosynthesis protein [Desulfovibrio sp. OttesenSCG-928-G11]
MSCFPVPALALALDLLLGDPPSLPHPVRGIGWLAGKLEAPARQLAIFCGHPVLAGALALAILCSISGGLAALLCALPGFLGTAMALYLAFSGLALGGLTSAGQDCLTLIEKAQKNSADLPKARRAVQMLVSRDTAAMEAPELYRSLAESLSENLNDAFVAPFFWLCLSGPVGLWLYKTVSTMDSMWGYKNERFLHLGRASARLDDLLAFIPARLCVLLMLATAWARNLPGVFSAWRKAGLEEGRKKEGKAPLKKNIIRTAVFSVPGWPGWGSVARQAKGMDSPNAGWPMAAAAWLFNGRSGGPTPYDGEIKEKALLGPDSGLWTARNCAQLLAHARATGIAGLILSALLLCY